MPASHIPLDLPAALLHNAPSDPLDTAKLSHPHCAPRAYPSGTLDAAKAWMLKHQLGRRNLTPEQMSYLRGKAYQLQKHVASNTQGINQHTEAKSKSCTYPQETEKQQDTAKKLAAEHKVSRQTIHNDATFATAVDRVTIAVGLDAKHAILARDTKLGRQEVKQL